MLIQAGVFAELDRINGVAANIMLGQVAPCGTGDSEIYIDEAALQKQGYEVEVPAVVGRKVYDNQEIKSVQQIKPQMPNLPNYSAEVSVPEKGDDTKREKIQSDELIFD